METDFKTCCYGDVFSCIQVESRWGAEESPPSAKARRCSSNSGSGLKRGETVRWAGEKWLKQPVRQPGSTDTAAVRSKSQSGGLGCSSCPRHKSRRKKHQGIVYNNNKNKKKNNSNDLGFLHNRLKGSGLNVVTHLEIEATDKQVPGGGGRDRSGADKENRTGTTRSRRIQQRARAPLSSSPTAIVQDVFASPPTPAPYKSDVRTRRGSRIGNNR